MCECVSGYVRKNFHSRNRQIACSIIMKTYRHTHIRINRFEFILYDVFQFHSVRERDGDKEISLKNTTIADWLVKTWREEEKILVFAVVFIFSLSRMLLSKCMYQDIAPIKYQEIYFQTTGPKALSAIYYVRKKGTNWIKELKRRKTKIVLCVSNMIIYHGLCVCVWMHLGPVGHWIFKYSERENKNNKII